MTHEILLVALATLAYLVAAFWQVRRLISGQYCRIGFLSVSLLALVTHAALLHTWIDHATWQNLAPLNMFSMVAWLVAMIVWLMLLIRPVRILVVLVFIIAAISIPPTAFFAGHDYVSLTWQPHGLFHVLLAILTFSILCIAGLQALTLALQDYVLKHRYQGVWIKYLPPLESMETSLFETIFIGFILLTVMLITSLVFYHQQVLTDTFVLQKAVVTTVAWLIFLLLLIGRRIWGWRGRRATYFTLAGVWLLVVVYYGSRLVLGG